MNKKKVEWISHVPAPASLHSSTLGQAKADQEKLWEGQKRMKSKVDLKQSQKRLSPV